MDASLDTYQIDLQVSGVVGRADLLSAFLSLLTFVFYHRAANAKHITSTANAIATLFCCVLSVMAMLCKEQGLMIMVKHIDCFIYEDSHSSADVVQRFKEY